MNPPPSHLKGSTVSILTVTVFYNLALRDKFFGYEDHHRLANAGSLVVRVPDDPDALDPDATALAAAERVWRWAQRADGLNATTGVSVPEHFTTPPTGDDWLDERRAPSLSVGDVLRVAPLDGSEPGTWLAVDRFGYAALPADGPRFIVTDDFATAMGAAVATERG